MNQLPVCATKEGQEDRCHKNTFLSLSLAFIQPPYFIVSLMTDADLSTNFSSGKGSHLLLDRLLGLLLYFGNDDPGVELCKLLQEIKHLRIHGQYARHYPNIPNSYLYSCTYKDKHEHTRTHTHTHTYIYNLI